MRKHARGAVFAGLIVLVSCEKADLTASDRSLRTPNASSTRPNFVILVTDDQRADDTLFVPTTMARVAHQGTVFANAFVTHSLCCPSRATILTGLYTHNHGVESNQLTPTGGYGGFIARGNESRTIAVQLAAAGYSNGLFGKYFNHYDGVSPPQGWSRWFAFVDAPFGGKFRDYFINDDGTKRSFGTSEGDYSTDVLREAAVAFVSSQARAARPFFAYIAPYAPHSPATPARRHAAAVPDSLVAPRIASFNEPDMSDKHPLVQERQQVSGTQLLRLDNQYRKRQASLIAVDELLDAVLDTLEATGQLANTYIIVTSDNGFSQGEHRLYLDKGWAYETDIRVPLFVRGPGVQVQVRDEIVLNNDLAPTLARLAGITDARSDGRPLDQLLRGEPVRFWRRRFLIEAHADNVLRKGLRSARYKYVEWEDGFRELYDLKKDPLELRNIASSADRGLLARLQYHLSVLRTCSARACRDAEVRVD